MHCNNGHPPKHSTVPSSNRSTTVCLKAASLSMVQASCTALQEQAGEVLSRPRTNRPTVSRLVWPSSPQQQPLTTHLLLPWLPISCCPHSRHMLGVVPSISSICVTAAVDGAAGASRGVPVLEWQQGVDVKPGSGLPVVCVVEEGEARVLKETLGAQLAGGTYPRVLQGSSNMHAGQPIALCHLTSSTSCLCTDARCAGPWVCITTNVSWRPCTPVIL